MSLSLLIAPAAPAAADLDCADFSSQDAAQQHLDADRRDPDALDRDRDGLACEWPREKDRLWMLGVYAGVLGGMVVASWAEIAADDDWQSNVGMALFALVLGTAVIGFIPALFGSGIAEKWSPPGWTPASIGLLGVAIGLTVGYVAKLLLDRHG